MDENAGLRLYEALNAIKKKQTGIRNTNEKEHFFNRKIEQTVAGDISRVEVPDTKPAEVTIPGYKDDGSNADRRQYAPPFPREWEPLVEARNQGNNDTGEVYREIQIMLTHYPYFLVPASDI